jgi:hypothetical protein
MRLRLGFRAHPVFTYVSDNTFQSRDLLQLLLADRLMVEESGDLSPTPGN